MADTTSSSTSSSTSSTPSGIPNVPIRTPMYDDSGNLTRTWIYFFERLARGLNSTTTTTSETTSEETAAPSTAAGPYQRTLLLKDTTVGTDVADHTVVYGATEGQSSTCQRVVGVLRKAISSPLTVRLKRWVSGVPAVVGTFTIPSTTAVNKPIEYGSFSVEQFPDLSVLSWDVVASDGSSDAAGIASFTVEWQ